MRQANKEPSRRRATNFKSVTFWKKEVVYVNSYTFLNIFIGKNINQINPHYPVFKENQVFDLIIMFVEILIVVPDMVYKNLNKIWKEWI